MFTFFRRIQWKLTFSYAFVTVSTVIVLAALMVSLALYFENTNNTRTYDSFYWSKTAFQDNIPYLLDNPVSMQNWLERVYNSGFDQSDFQSYTVRETLDYANTFQTGTPVYILDPQLNLITAMPAVDRTRIGQPFDGRAMLGFGIETALQEAVTGSKAYFSQSVQQSDGGYVVAFPLRKSDDEPVEAIVIYRVKPIGFATPSNLEIYGIFFLVMTFIILLVSLPVGAVFGWLVSRGLRNRLIMLSTAAKAWSMGNFSYTPSDHSGDEIGELTRNLASMAGQLQTHLHTRDELARIEERNRLARDLHDTVKQQTYAARMQLSAAKNLLTSDPASAAGHLEAALQLNRETQQELKLIIEELRPAALEGKGLAQAVAEYTARWQEHTGIRVEIAITGERSLPFAVEQTLYRVLQETLSNVARHSEAESVKITLDMAQAQVSLTIEDNGRGFEPAAVATNSLGLVSMKQRLAEVHGNLTVESRLGAGTQIIARVALPQ